MSQIQPKKGGYTTVYNRWFLYFFVRYAVS